MLDVSNMAHPGEVTGFGKEVEFARPGQIVTEKRYILCDSM
jgi:hypothetical protein